MYGKRIATLRDEKGLCQVKFGELFGITRVTVSHYETEIRTPSMELLIKMAKYFNVTTDYLLGVSNCRSFDANLQGMSATTGISDASIEFLKRIRKEKLQPVCETFPNTVNFLLETEAGQKILENIQKFLDFKPIDSGDWAVKSDNSKFVGALTNEQYRQVFLLNISTILNETKETSQ